MTVIFQFIQGVGALVGLITGIVYFADRLFRHYPTAFIVTRPLMLGAWDRHALLRFQNKAGRPILLSWKSGTEPNRLQIAKGNTVRDTVVALVQGERWLHLDSEEVTELDLIKPPNYRDLSPEAEIFTEVSWRFAQPAFYKRTRKIAVRITKRDLEIMLRGEADQLDEEH